MLRSSDVAHMCIMGCGVALALSVPLDGASAANTESVLYSFCNQPGCADGSVPYDNLIADGNGNLYGTTYQGGTSGNGTVFKLSPTGTETVLYSFTGGNDGGIPYAGLVMDASGNLYGTTVAGGASGNGTVFKVASDGTETVLWTFTGGNDGASPLGRLKLDKKGNLYGTAYLGGASGNGNVFKLSPKGKETVLYSFTGGSDGANPFAGLIRDKRGNLYGTTSAGGAAYSGTAFKLAKDGTFTLLYSFCSQSRCTDGGTPFGGLIADTQGNLYGTTSYGGNNTDNGTVFKLTPNGAYTVLYTFCSQTGCSDGGIPYDGMIADKQGNLYGTTSSGGNDTVNGTVFALSAGGGYSVLYTFTGGSDGGAPFASLMKGTKGEFFGTTTSGGAYGSGTVFKLKK